MYVPKKHKNKNNINTKEKQRKTNSEPKKTIWPHTSILKRNFYD